MEMILQGNSVRWQGKIGTTDASDLGLPPGRFPYKIRAMIPNKGGWKEFYLARLNDSGAVYHNLHDRPGYVINYQITIWND